MAAPRLRWAVDLGQWTPSNEEFDFLCCLIPQEEAIECKKFKFRDDQKRALVSRLLQRHAAATVLGIPHTAVEIKRTRGRKPYVANAVDKPHAPNFNYSVSHEGNYVVLAAEGICLCGCDIAAPNQLRCSADRPLDEVLSAFKTQLTLAEWEIVRSAGADDSLIESKFRQFWSLKEVGSNKIILFAFPIRIMMTLWLVYMQAFVKATGEGLGYDLGKIDFHIADNNTARVSVEGALQPAWAFHLHLLGNGHWVSVARGPLTAIVDAWGVRF